MDRPVALVTGTSRGIGKGIVEHFINQGYFVAGCSRGEPSLKDPSYHHSQLDVGVDKQVWEWVTNISKTYGRVDLAINNISQDESNYKTIILISDGATEGVKYLSGSIV